MSIAARSTEEIVNTTRALRWWLDEQIAKGRTTEDIEKELPLAIEVATGRLPLELLHRIGSTADEIRKHGFAIRYVDYCEDARTPGLLGQIAGVTDWERREVKVALKPLGHGHAATVRLAEVLEHEARHVREPDWDCGNRDVLGRGGGRPS